jgi:two-component system chemotaxis response regulator CheB
MLAQQDEALEEALWTALKTLEERASLTQRMLQQAQQRGQRWLVQNSEDTLQRTEQHIRTLITVLQNTGERLPTETAAQGSANETNT